MTGSTVTGSFTGLTNTPTIIKQSSIASATGGDQFPIYFGVSVTPNLEAGSYTMAKDTSNNPGTIVYQLTVPISCQQYTVEFNGNGGTTANSETTYTQIIPEDVPTNLNPNTFTRTNYTFAGWTTNADGTGTSYANEAEVTNLTGTEQTIVLYAKWDMNIAQSYAEAGKQKITVGSNSYYKMQDMDSTICDRVTVLDEPGQTQLIDIRDNEIYWATKLQDGHCWMTQNLDLNLSTSTALTNQDTDLNTVTSWTPVRSTINAVTDASTAGSIQGYTNDYNTPYSVDTGDYYWNNATFYPSTNCSYTVGGIIYQGCNYVTKADANWKNYFSTTPYASNGTHGHVGNYYNWSAAVASNDTSSYTASTMANIASNPQNSICPKGWRLPTVSSQTPAYDTAGSPNEFARLAYFYNNYTGNTAISSEGLEKDPVYMSRPGNVNAGMLYHAGFNGLYWSSTVSSATVARLLGIDSTVVYPELEYGRYYGFSLRCLAR
ncbi:InlB B-repeat-containing protein [Candidatus Saccharibacteria bacterium]|nr:InlB B-repeat-containing protein [Candidatus Saccharibacteria bacterium]